MKAAPCAKAADAIGRAPRGVPPICFTCPMATISQSPREGAAPWQTHAVFNQVPPLEGIDVFSSNLPLVEALEHEV